MDKIIPKPTEAEMEILQILWAKGSAPVRQVNELLNEKRSTEVGYTTTLKMMQIMLEKKLVLRDADERTHIYRANIAEQETQNAMLSNMVENVFRGSASRLVMQALGNHQASSEELDEIKAMIAALEQGK